MKSVNIHRIQCVAGDFISCVVSVFCFNLFRHWWLYGGTDLTFATWSHDLPVALGYVAFPVAMVLIYAVLGFYNEPAYKSRYELLSNTIGGALIGSLVIYFAIMVNDNFQDRMLHYSFLLMLFLSLTVPVLFERFLFDYIMRRRIEARQYTYNVMVIGSGRSACEFASRLEEANARMGYKVVGVLNDKDVKVSGDYAYPAYTFDELDHVVDSLGVRAFVVHCDDVDSKSSVETVSRLYSYGRSILIPLHHYNLITARPKLINVLGEPLVDVTSTGLSACYSNLKRIGDVICSFMAIVLLLPVYAVLALLVKLDSPGPVFYRQVRIGRHRKPFKIIKFRSMIVDSEPEGPALSSAGDSRITRLGRIMRKYRLDELPQFWNVLRGDMSLVGPRPEREYYLDKIREREPAVCTIHSIRPGITSLGSVKFGYAGNIDEMMKRFYFDMLYMENMSFSMDIKILFHTVATVITGKGV